MSIYVKTNSGVSTIVDYSVLHPEFELIGQYYGLEIKHCNIGVMHFVRINGNLTTEIKGVSTLNITLPDKYKGGYYVSEFNRTGYNEYKIDKSGVTISIQNCNTASIPKNTYIHKWFMYYEA